MRVSGFVMTDESGEVLAVSVGGSADLAKSLAAQKAAPESPAELAAEHERLVDVLRSPDHKDDLEEANRQEAELAGYRAEAGEEMSKAHVKGYTRKDGTFVKEHDDNRQAAQPDMAAGRPVPAQQVNAITDKHSEALNSKAPEWNHEGYRGRKIPAADVAKLPEFSHKEVYGHDGKTSPAGTDFAPEFAKNGHQGFVIKHPNGKRSFVDTQGYNYARYHAPVADAPAGGAGGAAYDHPNVVGKVGKMTNYEWSKESGTKPVEHKGVPSKAHEFEFAGEKYSPTGRTGNSLHDNTPVTAAESEDGHRIWVDDAGRVHADSTDEVPKLRQKYEAHTAKADKPKKAAAKKPAAKKAAAPAVKTQNEGYGYHGEAMNQHIREKHGEDTYHGSLSEKDMQAAYEAGHKKFAEAAQKLVDGGHFDDADQARDYLDSTHGRHLHDGATFHGGDISKVQWLAKDVAAYKKKVGGKPMAKALLFVGSKAGAAELVEMAKSHVAAYTRKDGVFVADHERRLVAHLPERVKSVIRDVATSEASPEHKKAAIDALVAPHIREAGFGFDEGAGVKVTGRVGGQGQVGVIHEVAPSGHFYIVKFPDGSRASYHESDLSLDEGDDGFDDDDWENER